MPAMRDAFDQKEHRASRRAGSLSKDRAQFKKQSLDWHGHKDSAAPRGLDFATPHRAARVAIRTRLANGTIATSSDMPQISMGRAGYWVRWLRKPSISKMDKLTVEELDIDESFMQNQKQYDMEADSIGAFPGYALAFAGAPFNMDVDDQKLFPPLVPLGDESVTRIPIGVGACESEKEASLEEEAEISTPEESSQCITDVQCPGEDGKSEIKDEWVLVSSCDAEDPTAKLEPEVPSMDWSVAGMPRALLRQLIRGSANAAHHSLHSEKRKDVTPISVMRAQNIGSSKRQRSTPKSPRSESKPRVARQSSIGRR